MRPIKTNSATLLMNNELTMTTNASEKSSWRGSPSGGTCNGLCFEVAINSSAQLLQRKTRSFGNPICCHTTETVLLMEQVYSKVGSKTLAVSLCVKRRLTRWANALMEFDYFLAYDPGELILNADALTAFCRRDIKREKVCFFQNDILFLDKQKIKINHQTIRRVS